MRAGGRRPGPPPPSRLTALAVAAAVLVAGCGLLPSAPAPALDGPWELVTIDGRPPAADAELSFGSGKVQVRTGCNNGSGSYQVSDGRFELTEFALTAMGCPGARGDQETEFLRIADGSPTVSVGGVRLALALPDGTGELVFVRR